MYLNPLSLHVVLPSGVGHFDDPVDVVPSAVVWPVYPDEVSSCGVARSSCPCLNRRQTTTKNIGTKKIAKTVAESMPPTTARPMAFCPPAPAPFDTASGSTPNTKASEVIRIGRSEEHTSELQSLMRITFAVLCLKIKTRPIIH